MSNKSIKLDVDPSIIEKNLLLDTPGDVAANAEVQKFLKSASNEPQSIFFKPLAGFCIKTRAMSDDKKIFINICHTEKIPPPDDLSDDRLVQMLQCEEPTNYRVPISIGDPRSEIDKSGQAATAYDVAVNTQFFEKLQKSEVFHSFFIAIVFEGIQDKYQIEIQIDKYVVLKNKKCVGDLQMHKIMQRDVKKCIEKTFTPLIEEINKKDNVTDDNKIQEQRKNQINEYKSKGNNSNMKYKLRRVLEDEKMKYLVGEFHMETMLSAKDLKVDVGEDRIVIEGKNLFLDIFVPCVINQTDVNATLDQNTRILTVKMAATEA